jgi:large subunit ribosomal protein L4
MTATGTVMRNRVKKERPDPIVRTAIRRNAAGHNLGTVDLEPSLFGLTPNLSVLHQVVTAQLAAARAGTQSTRTRAEVRGGGAKPFRQKGTGRARQGSTRSPSMTGGGVALGPKPRSYAQRTPKKMVRLALLSALSDRAQIGRVCVIDDWKLEEPSTRDAAIIVRKLRLDGSVLVVLTKDELDVERSFANLPRVQTTTFDQLSAHDVLRADWLVFSDLTVPKAAGHAGADGEEASTGETTETSENSEATEAEAVDTDTAAVDTDTAAVDTDTAAVDTDTVETEEAETGGTTEAASEGTDPAAESAGTESAAESADADAATQSAEADSASELTEEGETDA